MIEILPTVVPQSLDDIARLADAFGDLAPALHVDVADGAFAPNTTWMPESAETLPRADTILYEAHCMVADPLAAGTALTRAGARRIIAHIEAFADAADISRAFEAWRAAGAAEVGLAVLLETPLQALDGHIGECAVIHLMTIQSIGKQGIPFDPRGVERVRALHEQHPQVVISVDGGVGEATIGALAQAGASRFCVGSALSGADDPRAVYNRLRARASGI